MLHFGWMLKSTVNNSTKELRLEKKVFEARRMDPRVVTTPISESRRFSRKHEHNSHLALASHQVGLVEASHGPT